MMNDGNNKGFSTAGQVPSPQEAHDKLMEQEPKTVPTKLAQAQTARKLGQVVAHLRTAVDSDLSIVSLHTLLLIASYGEAGCYSSDLVDRLGVSKAAISRTVANLSNRRHGKAGTGYNLITVEPDPTDIRRKLLKLTADGRKLIAELTDLTGC